MRETIVRHQGPLLLAAIELEAPSRLLVLASPAEADRLLGWVKASPEREAVVKTALLAQDGVRAEAWMQHLCSLDGGIVAAYGALARAEMRRGS